MIMQLKCEDGCEKIQLDPLLERKTKLLSEQLYTSYICLILIFIILLMDNVCMKIKVIIK